jgi:glycosyltransferase involved in cell wall biosynthesis
VASLSVVIPSFNQGRFLSACLDSTLAQADEVLLLDAASTDETHSVIERYASRLDFWRSEPDAGQAAAINEGFRRSRARIFAWLNSDDVYEPGGLSLVKTSLASRLEQPVVCYGGCVMFHEGSPRIEHRPALPFDPKLLCITDFLDQPSVFWTRKAWELVGPLDESLHYAFDWDWFLRAAKVCRFIRIDAVLARYRIHKAHKSGTGGQKRWMEMMAVVRRHSPSEVVRHYEYLDQHPAARSWLNKRMRLSQQLGKRVADFLSPPFWSLPSHINRETLWKISGIR